MPKSNRKLRLRTEAQLDIRSILRYTSRQWGAHQKIVYRTTLNQAMLSLLDFPERGRSQEDHFPGCRSIVVEQHVVFYLVTKDEIVVSRVIHVNQDATGLVTS